MDSDDQREPEKGTPPPEGTPWTPSEDPTRQWSPPDETLPAWGAPAQQPPPPPEGSPWPGQDAPPPAWGQGAGEPPTRPWTQPQSPPQGQQPWAPPPEQDAPWAPPGSGGPPPPSAYPGGGWSDPGTPPGSYPPGQPQQRSQLPWLLGGLLLLLAIIGGVIAFGLGEDDDGQGVALDDAATAEPSAAADTPPATSGDVQPPVTVPVAPGDTEAPAEQPSAEAPPPAGDVTTAFDLEVGQCIQDPLEGEEQGQVSDILLVDCNEPHDGEVYALVDHPAAPGEPFIGQEAMIDYADTTCFDQFEGYVGTPYAQSRYYYFTIYPTAESWKNGDREVVCVATFGPGEESLVGSVRDSGQ